MRFSPSAWFRRRSPGFDADWYLATYPDVRAAIDAGSVKSARLHYTRFGKAEGRLPRRPSERQGDFDALQAAERRLAADLGPFASRTFLTPEALSTTAVRPQRMLLVGSCQLEELAAHQFGTAPIASDYLLLNEPGELPTPPRPLEDYDLQLSQISLRAILRDADLWWLPYGDLAAHEAAFETSRAKLRRQLDCHLQPNRRSGLLTFVLGFQAPQQNPMGRLLPRFDLRNPAYFVQRLNEEMERICREHDNVYVVDIDAIHASIGRRYIQDDSWTMVAHGSFLPSEPGHLNRIEPTPALDKHFPRQVDEAFGAIWNEIVAMYRTARQAEAVKMVVVDLDDTLWNGVAAEHDDPGPELVEGWPLGVAEALAYLKKRGVLLGLLSKNDEARVEALWERIYGARFLLSAFAVKRINWRPKTENMAELLAEANLLPRSVAYVDDHPAERAAMRAAFPDMRVLDGWHYYWRKTLLWAPELQVASISEESERRTEMIRAQAARATARSQMSENEFLKDQDLRVEVEALKPGGAAYARAFELINKTNQFNTTGERWSAEDFAAFVNSAGRAYVFRASDRFTPYGLIGVALIEGRRVRQVVMSCRVVGRGVEIAALAVILRGLGDGPAVTARTRDTDANLLSRDLFARLGFTGDGEGLWTLSGSVVEPPAHIAVEEGVRL